MKIKNLMARTLLAAAVASAALPAAAYRDSASELSGLSMLPIAISVAAPVMLLSAGAMFTVVAVESASGATVWVLERASDGARISINLSGQLAACTIDI